MLFEIKNYAEFQSAMERLCAFLAEREISEEKVFDSRLVAHELVGNALQHAQGGASLEVELLGERIRITVRGEEVFCPPDKRACPQCFAERGRGIFLVDSVCEERIFTADGAILVHIKL